MALFEYRCLECNRKFAQLVGMTADSSEPTCPRCGSRRVGKLISRFSRARSEDEALDSLEGAALSADPDDPRAMRKWVREMGKELDEEGGEDFEEYLEEAERDSQDGEADVSL